jgi:glycosyltransferase involved in cell wall biosynthesis
MQKECEREPLVSIIIPARDEEKYIDKFSLPSIEKQTYRNLETIVVCNGCKDRTADVARGFSDKIKNLIIIETEKSGVGYARNLGAKYASGSIFAFPDADVALKPNTIEEIVKVKNKYENIIGICKGYPKEKNLKARILIAFKNIFLRPFIVSNGLIFCNREFYHKIGGFREDIERHEDGKFIRKGFKYTLSSILSNKYKYICLANTHVTISMRRFEKKGYIKAISEWLRPAKSYPVVR